MDKRGWSDPVKAMMCLASAARTLSLGKGKFSDRMATATYPLGKGDKGAVRERQGCPTAS
jgi:hypothetical protein